MDEDRGGDMQGAAHMHLSTTLRLFTHPTVAGSTLPHPTFPSQYHTHLQSWGQLMQFSPPKASHVPSPQAGWTQQSAGHVFMPSPFAPAQARPGVYDSRGEGRDSRGEGHESRGWRVGGQGEWCVKAQEVHEQRGEGSERGDEPGCGGPLKPCILSS